MPRAARQRAVEWHVLAPLLRLVPRDQRPLCIAYVGPEQEKSLQCIGHSAPANDLRAWHDKSRLKARRLHDAGGIGSALLPPFWLSEARCRSFWFDSACERTHRSSAPSATFLQERRQPLEMDGTTSGPGALLALFPEVAIIAWTVRQ